MRELFRRVRAIRCGECHTLITETFSQWLDDKAPRLGAALAFYTALSLAPLLVIMLAIAGLAYGQQAAQGQLVWQMKNLLGAEGAKAIQALIAAAHRPANGIIATIIGLITLFFGASSAFVELSDALNTIWRVQVKPGRSGIASALDVIKRRSMSFLMVVAAGIVLLLSVFLGAWISATEKLFRGVLPLPGATVQIVNLLISFLAITALFALIYKVLPDVRLRWSDVIIGAAITSALFSIGKLLIGIYLAKTTIASSYGAAGSFLIVLLWVYYSAQIFFLGAEFTKIYTLRFGSLFRATLELQPERPAEVIATGR